MEWCCAVSCSAAASLSDLSGSQSNALDPALDPLQSASTWRMQRLASTWRTQRLASGTLDDQGAALSESNTAPPSCTRLATISKCRCIAMCCCEASEDSCRAPTISRSQYDAISVPMNAKPHGVVGPVEKN